MHNSAEALKKLVNYFSGADEPTMIIFFGDHRPGAGLTDNTSVYTQLGILPEEAADWTLEQKIEFHSTDYLIWANDDSLLPGERGEKAISSANTLGLPILDVSGADKSLWWRFADSVSRDAAFFSWDFYVSADGVTSAPPQLNSDTRATDKLSIMAALLSDAFYGRRYVTEALWDMK